MRAFRVVPGLIVLFGLVACGEPADRTDAASQPDTVPTEAPAPVPQWVEQVARVANDLEARPAASDSILAAHDMPRATFDSLIYEIAADPELNAAYRAARQ